MIQIGKCIYTLLSGDTTVHGYVGLKIYPLVIPEAQTLPCIVYERHGDGEITKDHMGIKNTIVEITILSEDYTESINIAQAVEDRLGFYQGTVNGVNIVDIRLFNVNESFSENAFIQKIDFIVKSI